jgi:hypothetical protein
MMVNRDDVLMTVNGDDTLFIVNDYDVLLMVNGGDVLLTDNKNWCFADGNVDSALLMVNKIWGIDECQPDMIHY